MCPGRPIARFFTIALAGVLAWAPASHATEPPTGLPNVILHLAFSPDGQYLAAALGGRNGVRVYRNSDWQQVGPDGDYGDDSYSTEDFSSI